MTEYDYDYRLYKLKHGSPTAIWAAKKIEELEAKNQRLREALEDLYSMASSPQWRNDPLYLICELIEEALEQSDE